MPPEFTLNTVFLRDDSILESDLGTEKVMMSIEHGRYYGLNETGRQIYDRCDGESTLGDICQALETEYDRAPDLVQEKVLAFVERLVSQRLLRST